MSQRQLKKLPESLPLMQKMYDRLTGEVIEIDAQAAEAKSIAASTGVFRESAWFAAATKALRIKRSEMQRLQVLIAQEKKSARAQAGRTFEQAFMEAARAFMSKDDYAMLMERALARMPEEHRAAAQKGGA